MSVQPADLLGPYITVFDVGAFQGDFARACLERWPNCVVHSFEPLADEPADRWAERGRWSWYPVALARQPGRLTMHRNVFLPSSSVLPMLELHEDAFPYTKGSQPVEVTAVPLEDYAGEVVAPALLKIDVQGYELEVLLGAGDAISLFDAVVLEVSHEPLYDGAPTPDHLGDHLADLGFSHHSRVDVLYHPGHPSGKGRLLQSDELWVRG